MTADTLILRPRNALEWQNGNMSAHCSLSLDPDRLDVKRSVELLMSIRPDCNVACVCACVCVNNEQVFAPVHVSVSLLSFRY